MSNFWELFVDTFKSFNIFSDTLDILLVTYVIFIIIKFLRETRAAPLIKGLVVLLIATLFASLLKMTVTSQLISGVLRYGVLAVCIIFQPEIRSLLERMGRGKIRDLPIFADSSADSDSVQSAARMIVGAAVQMSKTRTGALIVVEGNTRLGDIINSGTVLNAQMSEELLLNIFYPKSPLHDGAAIVRDSRILAAGCVLPLTQNKDLNKELGTRHRAGIGITENSDALVIIVSEETGVISIAQNGKLTRFLDGKKIEKTLLNLYLEEEVKVPFTERLRRLLKGGQRC